MIAFFADRDLFYGYAFFLPALIYLLNMIFMFKLSFPNHKRETEYSSTAKYSRE